MEFFNRKPGLKIMGILLGMLSSAVISQAASLDAAHQIQIELFPSAKKLIGQSEVTIKTDGAEVLEFRLTERETRIEVQVNQTPRKFNFNNGRLRLPLKSHERSGELRVVIHYSAIFDDPAPMRPVNTDNPGFGVTATISEQGSFLLAGAGWYPELVDSQATYKLTVTAPSGLIAVTAGRSLGHRTNGGKTVSGWEVNYPLEGLSLSVGRYLVEEKSVGDIIVATYLLPQNDFALEHFQSRYDLVTRTIGYDKGTMIFHMIRQTLGEEAFWGALRDIYRTRLFRRTSWSDLQQAFETRGKRSLQAFFDQWVYRRGAPRFWLDGVRVEDTGGIWKVKGQIVQSRPYFGVPLTLALQTPIQTAHQKFFVSGRATPFELDSDHRPQKLIADPDDDVFRRLSPSEIPSAVNTLKSASSVLTVLSEKLDPEIKKAAEMLALSLGLKHNPFVTESELNGQMLAENDILVIGLPRRNDLLQKMPAQITIQSDSFVLNDRRYDKPSDTFFGVFEHPATTNRVAALFMPLSAQYAEVAARKITHYGKYSYLAFQSGKNLDKGIWAVETSPLVYEWDSG